MLEIQQLSVLNDNYIYLLHDLISKQTAVVDPALAAPVLDCLNSNNWHLSYIFNTHHHADHVGGNLQLKQTTGCKIIGAHSDSARIPGIDIVVTDGETILLGTHEFQIIATPGHTSGHIVFYCAEIAALFCGDTLFSLGCGRLFEGTADQMWQSLQKLKALPPETQVFCAHEYTQANGRFALTLEKNNQALLKRIAEVNHLRRQDLATIPSTIALELVTNPFLREHSPDLREAIGLKAETTPAQVFAKIRQLKDQFG